MKRTRPASSERLKYPLIALFEIAAERVPASIAPCQRVDDALGQRFRHLAAGDLQRQPFGDAVLPTPGSPTRSGLFFFLRAGSG